MPRHKPSVPETPLPDGASNKFERFLPKRISRTQIENAPYNPRQISPAAKKQLRDNIEKVGLVEPLIWNKRTGNLVGGHQRLAILDSLQGSGEYKLTVAEVDLAPEVEATQNVFLNNPSAQGTFDPDKMTELLINPVFEAGGGIAAAGWSPYDWEAEFGLRPDVMIAHMNGDVVSPSYEAPDEPDVVEDPEPADSHEDATEESAAPIMRNTPEAIKQRKAEYEAKASKDPNSDSEYMLMVSFDSTADKNMFLSCNGMRSDLKFIGAADLRELLKEECRW